MTEGNITPVTATGCSIRRHPSGMGDEIISGPVCFTSGVIQSAAPTSPSGASISATAITHAGSGMHVHWTWRQPGILRDTKADDIPR